MWPRLAFYPMWSKGVQAICVAAGDGVAGARARKESWGPISKGLLGHASKLPRLKSKRLSVCYQRVPFST